MNGKNWMITPVLIWFVLYDRRTFWTTWCYPNTEYLASLLMHNNESATTTSNNSAKLQFILHCSCFSVVKVYKYLAVKHTQWLLSLNFCLRNICTYYSTRCSKFSSKLYNEWCSIILCHSRELFLLQIYLLKTALLSAQSTFQNRVAPMVKWLNSKSA